MAEKTRSFSRRAQTNVPKTHMVTSKQLAAACRVTVKTIRRWYQQYNLIPPPQIVRNPRSRGTRAVWPQWVVTKGRRIVELQREGLSREAVRAMLVREDADHLKESLEQSLVAPINYARDLAARVIASDELQDLVREHLELRLSGVGGHGHDRVAAVAYRYARDATFIQRLFLFVLTGFTTVCCIDPLTLELSVTANVNIPWHLTTEASMARFVATQAQQTDAARAFASETLIVFNVASLMLSLGLAMDDSRLLATIRAGGVFHPAPLVWSDEGGAIAEYALSGDWRDTAIVFPARRIVSPADASVFRAPTREDIGRAKHEGAPKVSQLSELKVGKVEE